MINGCGLTITVSRTAKYWPNGAITIAENMRCAALIDYEIDFEINANILQIINARWISARFLNFF